MLYKLRHILNDCYILVFHMISEEPNGFFPENSLHGYTKQLEYLRKNYDVISLEEVAKRISCGRSVRRCAAITFDDGFRDNYHRAYPLLKKFQVPATIFLTPDYIEKGEAPWFVKFRHYFMNTSKNRLELELGGQIASFSLRDPSEKRNASDKLMGYLQACPNEERLAILKDLPSLLAVDSARELQGLMLTWDQIREMSKNGIHFGAHTMTHPVLSQIGPEIMRYEIGASKEIIAEKIDRPINTFAYPFGRKDHYPPNAPKLLKELGFTCAVTTIPGTNSLNTHIYELKRSFPWEMAFI
jgi:peptidoglycan/xylan/chitin deacetylase (PgdA/CDA1 family)